MHKLRIETWLTIVTNEDESYEYNLILKRHLAISFCLKGSHTYDSISRFLSVKFLYGIDMNAML